MNIADVMDELGTALDTITGLRVFPYFAERITPPAAVVGWPDSYDYDQTLQRGADTVVMPVIVAVGRAQMRAARDQLAQYADGTGTASVKRVVEAHTPTAYDSARVQSVEFGTVTVAGTELLSATFNIEIIGTGA